MNDANFQQAVAEICARDPRYAPEGYYLLREALDFTVKALKKPVDVPERHVTGQELTEGIRQYMLQEFGPMSLTVLRAWGIQRTEDFGEIVFNLVESGKLGKTDKDTRADFAKGYDFFEVFGKPYEVAPDAARPRRTRRTKPGRA
ncbi:MAG: Minf_1886 family protein [bacterium]